MELLMVASNATIAICSIIFVTLYAVRTFKSDTSARGGQG